ncbi:MAG: DUF2784 domain-containing protein [Acidithiobacillales bacterium]
MYHLLADAVAFVHFLFVVFVIAGGLAAWRWPKVAWVHLPAALWGMLVEVMGWVCPLTPLEDRFRMLGGSAAAHGDFVTRYLLPVLYPERLTPVLQKLLGALVVAVNVAVYAFVLQRRRAARNVPV